MHEAGWPVQRVGAEDVSVPPQNATLKPKPQVLAFGVFELDASTAELRKQGRLIHLRWQPVRVLLMLLEKAGALVTRREITAALWPDDLDVDVEQGLNHCMKEIRAALGDRAESPRFVQTLPRRGYRFLGEVRDLRERAPSIPDAAALPAPATSPSVSPGSDDEGSRATSLAVSGDGGMRVRVKVLVLRPEGGEVLWSETYAGQSGELDRLEKDMAAGLRTGMMAASAAIEERAAALVKGDGPRRDPRFE